ncbi:TIGR01906 family membrane protein [Bombilactobacillus folatiphilus]|uniref:TIGR01906 family membrane protein n=1 Tax=Bombilactobacillus folatiphilus TaxID=2923362 RepID=A0ABY4PBG9_9LACO|nr:TIGR01906 family membrane protein [Bombilactobacillus folatiphilus]UQS82866.1 TIGR01906 family membrane protein [Bombilactobacillus folatiphilus]
MNLLFCIVSLIFLLSATVLLTIGGSYLIFWWDLHYLQLDLIVHLTSKQIWHSYQQVMQYLLLPIQTKFRVSHFISSPSGIEHFYEVKVLFGIVVFLFILSGCFLLLWLKKHQLSPLIILNIAFFKILLVVPWLLGIIVSIDFDGFFVAFHQLLFRNHDWLFDPLKDPIINILPDTFFAHCFFLAFIIFEVLVFLILIWKHQKNRL